MAPTLLLTTTGRKSSEPPTTPLFYLRDEEKVILCNVNPGFERPNPWTLNLCAPPLVQVQIGAQQGHYRAWEATAEEVAHYWPQFVGSGRPMPSTLPAAVKRSIFVLEPVGI